MAQTKRKRQTKHRGNAAGVIEARGRTGRPPTKEERKQASRAQAREARLNRPPSWKRSLQMALFAGALIFVFMLISNPKGAHHRSDLIPVIYAIGAIVLYTPGGYFMESFLYKRRMAKRAAQQRSPRR